MRRQVDLGGAGARRAHRDLDAIVALFELAARAVDQRDHVGVGAFFASLVAQQLPADTLAERGVRGSAVRLLTAHRSKGLEWDLVVVAHVQQEGWPDLRRRTTLLGADRIGVDTSGHPDLVPPVTTRALLMEERRLFYVACTRARRRLVVSAVTSPEDDGEQPSRFLEELGVTVEHQDGRPPRPLSLAGLVAELRRHAADPSISPALQHAAARRLSALASEDVDGRQLVPAADPSTWWGTRSATRSVEPIRDADRPVPVSASMLESILRCPAQWFFEREAGGVSAVHQSANLGQVLHALAERVAHGELPAEVDPLMAEVEAIWDRLAFRTPWSRQRELARIRKAVGRFVQWHLDNPRELLGAEQRFQSVVDVDGRPVMLTGFADRLEIDDAGRVVVVDFKSARTPPTGPAVAANLQLALYQYAVDAGAARRGGRAAGRVGRRRAGAARHRRRLRRPEDPGAAGPRRRRPRASRPPRGSRPGRRPRPRRDLPRCGRPALPRLPVRRDLPRQGRRERDRPVTEHAVRLDTPADLQALMGGFAPSDEQWAAITAPLRPTVVVAGAGSGKTTLMAQRVVWLVATGKVRPEEVLGLTFTTKAAAELRHRVTAALGAAGLLDRSVVVEGEDVLEPTVATYHAYAATLLTDHGLRIGHEPDTRVVSDASRYQLGARVIERFTGHIELLTDHPATAIQNLLALDGAMSEHLVDEDDVRRVDDDARQGVRARDRRGGGGQGTQDLPRGSGEGDQRDRPAGRAAPAGPRLPRPQGRPRADGLRRPDRPRGAAGRRPAGGGRARADALQGRPAGRVPGHLGRPGHDARPAVLRPGPRARARPPGDGGR